MIRMSVSDIVGVTGGYLADGADPDAIVTGAVEFDSRRIGPGGLFVCLPGAQVDGHDYAVGAVDSGATVTLAARETGAPSIIVPEVPVPDSNAAAYEHDPAGHGAAVIAALGRLARHNVDVATGHGMRVVGVTGSAGKTTVKDLIASVLREDGEVVAPPGSFNNEIGHPYTALRCSTDTDYLVAELSARGVGHIAELAAIAPPVVGVVLNVGTAHIGEFGDRDTIARAKGELVEVLPAAGDGGVAVLNADDPLVAAMAGRTRARVVTFSATGDPNADYRATGIELDDVCRATFTLEGPGGLAERVALNLVGDHQVANALAAAAAAVGVGLDPHVVCAAISAHEPVSGRRMEVTRRGDGVTVINDSYNANPDSMAAGIRTLAHSAAASGGTAWAVLGQMNELGPDSADRHAEIGSLLGESGIPRLVVVGTGVNTHSLAQAAEAAGTRVVTADSVDAAINFVQPALEPEDVVLVKASSSEQLWRVADALLALPVPESLEEQDPEQ
ncbi:UDP-N-acetylmuramoyl-tripeptide--D-alanyl-D-alanine ligase [Corynebacterium sp. CCM 8835]|uniref:UDP-N-acetylmuramoyl-tripeptide--D-alanyl-D-alanine ligase n=1 Tax=Corynebacterium antarcticum TaxID=2800405 RepID=A0A9Q4CAM3_9CORY|nr:UDP-N-acetylmuramoyl-tripeptide--D-alanyl-D-alanine ligase [Corynebacterium antarcticum]MCK7641801.1 UDP-N-acetylmuramoyl-tripeptide--D-alanyl-D-alanine ligase [Corynebacterium antarcticum]MCL0245030.1 UDP-N-acetylmuramoyl-tripeptide--D-alanyl-D-alanine ligase [Corynebacterium antarcticum]MCX7491404.1 UDP-N-acetylmuramoyl-tripeptide--D-alanyl-D-alanine ligase [Corynebacterium antarcticum]MCX7537423.1 UDP-N-acetylmuramoyl-tripeptide--D-alanyl-D-alanine ligase [Corynebacterium antarcticum]MCX